MSVFVRNLIRFASVLRAAGLTVPADRMIDVVTALGHIDIGRRRDFYCTLRSLLVKRQQDIATFDEAFLLYWRPPAREWAPHDLRALGEQRRFGPAEGEVPNLEGSQPGGTSTSRPAEAVARVVPFSYSAREISRTKDFASFTDEELKQAEAMLAALAWNPGERLTRRLKPARGRRLDLRRIVSRNAKYGAEWVILPTRERLRRRRPVVLLCDVSGSMERYSRILLHFAHGLVIRHGLVEAFVFATQLTRITRALVKHGADDAVRSVLGCVRDWGGGTRIGEALRAFNVEWARRVACRGPIVLLISDGWDRGEPDLLSREMGRLQRTSHRLIWLNPLLGAHGYQPLTRGMQAALPFVDDFLPVHNLDSLHTIAEHLNTVARRRPARRQREPRDVSRLARSTRRLN